MQAELSDQAVPQVLDATQQLPYQSEPFQHSHLWRMQKLY